MFVNLCKKRTFKITKLYTCSTLMCKHGGLFLPLGKHVYMKNPVQDNRGKLNLFAPVLQFEKQK